MTNAKYCRVALAIALCACVKAGEPGIVVLAR